MTTEEKAISDIIHLDNNEIRSVLDLHKISYQDVWTWFEKQCEQKSAWSEEDESMRRHLTLILMELGLSRVKYSTVPKYHFDREIEWLCNLHPQPKEEWSKKDETIKLDWLKSLFPQKQWKPSDEQIKVCKEAFIKKAVEWLSRHFYDEEYQYMDNEGVWICADELIDDFKEYMKGE